MDENDRAWAAVLPEAGLPERKPVRVVLDLIDILLYRKGEAIFAVGNRCTHQGAPLHRGRVDDLGAWVVVTCPAHGSRFRLHDGSVFRGPATLPLQMFDARISDGMIELRPRV